MAAAGRQCRLLLYCRDAAGPASRPLANRGIQRRGVRHLRWHCSSSLRSPPTSYAELMDRMVGALPFACSFALLVWIWFEHNSFFRRYGMQDGYTILLNSVLLFVVLLLCVPAEIHVRFGLRPVPAAARSARRHAALSAGERVDGVRGGLHLDFRAVRAALPPCLCEARGAAALRSGDLRCEGEHRASPGERRAWACSRC